MANPATIGEDGGVIEATTTEGSVTLDPYYRYAIWHNGRNTSGAADDDTIYFSTSAEVEADPAAGSGRQQLVDGASAPLPLGAAILRFKTATGAPTFSICAIDKPARFS